MLEEGVHAQVMLVQGGEPQASIDRARERVTHSVGQYLAAKLCDGERYTVRLSIEQRPVMGPSSFAPDTEIVARVEVGRVDVVPYRAMMPPSFGEYPVHRLVLTATRELIDRVRGWWRTVKRSAIGGDRFW